MAFGHASCDGQRYASVVAGCGLVHGFFERPAGFLPFKGKRPIQPGAFA